MARLIYTARFLRRNMAFWLRGLLCLAVGVLVLIGAGDHRFDLRFQLRGEQPVNSNIVVVGIQTQEWQRLLTEYGYDRNSPNYFDSESDSFFWHPEIWQSLLNNILDDQPQAIGVSLYFGDNIPKSNLKFLSSRAFRDRRVIWSSRLNNEKRASSPIFANLFSKRTGVNEYFADSDGIVRRYHPRLQKTPHLVSSLARTMGIENDNLYKKSSVTINYRGGQNLFPHVSISDVVHKYYPRDFFKGKVILIGVIDTKARELRTPVGDLPQVELSAQVLDNIVSDRGIHRLGLSASLLYLFTLLMLCAWIMVNYPQMVALVILTFVGLVLSAISLWVFDTFNFWLPLMAPLFQIAFTYIVYLSFQLTQKENQSWRLEQETKYISEVESLKNNFVSLISHDLKTPLAKINAICDRMITQKDNPEQWMEAVQSLRRESVELHRYIHSILQLTRLEAKEVKIHYETADINEIIFKVFEQVRPLANEKKIQIELQLEPLFLIDFDPILIREVILNLIENAIKYSPEGSLITLMSRESENMVTFEVKDQGPGIQAQELSQIFQKFYRGKGQSFSSTKGFGLGLYLVRYFIELHGGQVYVESEPGKGTLIGFTLPIRDADHGYPHEGELQWKTNSELSSSKMSWN